MHPLLLEITSRLQAGGGQSRAISGNLGQSRAISGRLGPPWAISGHVGPPRAQAAAEGSGARLTLLSGHDTVVAQLLAALDATGESERCGWPPYASRVVFEVWAPVRRDEGRTPALVVRALFNGVPQPLPGCSPGLELCPLRAFAQAVEARFSAQGGFERACAAKARL
uniref:Acid phosphatase n=1 Tax=Emiliania huxleyi TaxID=2903 RepID=A0A7S3SYK6_EMIHU